MKPQTLHCSCCQRPLSVLALEGHYTQSVEVDLCVFCHHVWFDSFESVRLSGLGWVQLLRRMLAAPKSEAVLAQPMHCVRCSGKLKGVRNLTRFGRSAAHECERGHGQYQSFALLLAERGLVRPMTSRDRKTILDEKREVCCLNCGAQVVGGMASKPGSSQETECAYCQSPLVVLDLQRLSEALLVRHGDAIDVEQAAQHLAWACTGCGQALDPTQDTRCPHCDHSVALPNLAAVKPLLDRIEPLLNGKAPRQAKPWGHKLANMRGDASATQLHRWTQHFKDMAGNDNASAWQHIAHGPGGWRPWMVALLAIAFLFYLLFA
jgi:DNA-directed RNA polymerase subunit RPC12/RpoP